MMTQTLKRLGPRLVLLAIGGTLFAGAVIAFSQKPNTENAPLSITMDQRPLVRENGQNSFAPVVKKVAPGVVKVYTTTRAHPASFRSIPEDMEDLVRRFFGNQLGNPSQTPALPVPRQHGVGSGVIVTKDGYLLTNNHVVDGAEEVKVALAGGHEFTAKVIGGDPKTDIAVLKIDSKDLPAVPMADSDNVEVGDLVLAIGNPFGIGQTVTTGIVSATGRSGTTGIDYEDFIQTDAAINPGNSGGALVDTEGRLIGINTAILSRTGGNQGIGFAIPANLAKYVMERLVEDGKVTRGYLGIMIQDVSPALAKEFKLEDRRGALVGDVTRRSPAERAGLKSGDVVVEYDAKPVKDSRRLRLEVARTRPGAEVPVKVVRDGTLRLLTVTVKELPGSEYSSNNISPPPDDTSRLSGVGVVNLNNQARRQYRLPAELSGALVTDVRPDSAAAEAGLRPGDVVQEVNRTPVRNAADLIEITANADNKQILLRVWRTGGSRYVVVDESEPG